MVWSCGDGSDPVTCKVTVVFPTSISFVRKSAPMVALYCEVKFLLTYVLVRVKEDEARRGEEARREGEKDIFPSTRSFPP